MTRIVIGEDGARSALDRLFVAEREALLGGRYADLARLAAQKADLVVRICGTTANASRLGPVKAALLRQEQLLRAARDGARFACRQPSDPRPLITYGPDGASGTIDPQGHRIARRF